MKNQRVTIVGGAGFIGRNIVKRLAARGARIAVASPHAVQAGFLRPMGDVGQIAAIDVGIGEETTLGQLIDGSDIVICAAGTFDTGRMDLVHHRGPAMLARLATRSGARRFLHVSAIGADAQSDSAYGRSKAAGEAAVFAAFPGATVVRPSLVFGPDDDLFNRFGAMARLLPVIPLIGGGETRFQPVFVGDVADAIVAALDRPDSAGKTYELGGPEILTFRRMMEMLLVEIRRSRLLLPIPAGPALFAAYFAEFLPSPLLTRDQVKMLSHDNVVATGMLDLKTLGIVPTALALILPTYLDRFRKGGRFAPATQTP
ncbi:MAG TPA: complex I NDUFA9 subunit family protein [Stellaceae bacterium]|jgi:NADH dehydrogenase|nr:complex I NDUFA9 subunit family protein [Stellaceae bacterium]